MTKPIAFLTSLTICAALLVPVLRLVGREPSWDLSVPEVAVTENGAFGEAVLSLASETICRELEAEVTYRFGIEEPRLSLSLDGSDPHAVAIRSGTLCGRGEVRAAASYLSEMLRCPITPEEAKEDTDGISR